MLFEFKSINNNVDIKVKLSDKEMVFNKHDTSEGGTTRRVEYVMLNELKVVSEKKSINIVVGTVENEEHIRDTRAVLTIPYSLLGLEDQYGCKNASIISDKETYNRLNDMIREDFNYSIKMIKDREAKLRARDLKLDENTKVTIKKVEKTDEIFYPYYITLNGYEVSYIACVCEFILSENEDVTSEYLDRFYDKNKDEYKLSLGELKKIAYNIALECGLTAEDEDLNCLLK